MREYKELRNSSLEPDRAAPYIGAARTLLGKLKNRMALGNISQGIDRTQLPDGTLITVRSVFGQDEINIIVPEPISLATFRYEFITVTDIGVSISFNKTQYKIKANNSKVVPITDFTVINNDNSNPSFPLFSQYQNVWHHEKGDEEKFNIVTAGVGIVRYSVVGNRYATARGFYSVPPSHITPDLGQQFAPSGSNVNAAAKLGDYLVGVTVIGNVIAWKIGEATFQSVAIVMPAWAETPQPTFWSFNRAGTKAISTVYEPAAPLSGSVSWPAGTTEWKASGYVELDIAIDENGVLSASVGRTKQGSSDKRPIIAVDYDYTVEETDQIIYLTLEEYDDDGAGGVGTTYLRAYSNEEKVSEFYIKASDGFFLWDGTLIAMDLRYRAFTWGHGQIPSDGNTFGSDWTGAVVRSDINGKKRAASALYSSAGGKSITTPAAFSTVTNTFDLMERIEREVIRRVPMDAAFAISVHPEGAWGIYAEFDHADAPEKIYTHLDVVHIPTPVGGPVIETTHRNLYDSARVVDPALPEITDGTNFVTMGAAAVWVQIERIA